MNVEEFLNSFSKGKKAEEDIENAIIEYVNNEADEKTINISCITKLLISFQMGKVNLLQFFQKMQYYFLNGREMTRQRATEYVFHLFNRYSGLLMSREEIQTLFSFFLTKLLDVATVKGANKVLLELLKNIIKNKEQMKALMECQQAGSFSEFTSSLVKQLIEQINDPKFNVSQYSQDVRDTVYANLKFIQDNFTQECLALGANFIKVIIESTEDEKDPRCIIKSFRLVRFVLDHFTLTALHPFLEDIFDNLECYYPVDFQHDEEQDKKYQISPKDLSEALDFCLINQHILQKTLDLINEKINSSYIDAKLAAFHTYSLIFKKYVPGQLTSAQRKQILDNIIENAKDIEEPELQESVVLSIKQFTVFITSTFKSDTNVIENTYYPYIKTIINHIFKLLEDGLLHHNAALSEKIMTALIPINSNLNYMIVNSVVKYFNSKFTNKDPSTASRQLEFVLLILLAAEKEIKQSSNYSFYPYFYLDEAKERILKNILMGEVQVGTDETIKILSVAILMKLAVYGKIPKDQGLIQYQLLCINIKKDIEFMSVCEDVGLSEMEIENYTDTVKKCMIEYCYLLNQKLASSHIKFLELRLVGLLGQQNMNEVVVNGFNSMILTNTPGWKECLTFIVENINNPEQSKLVEKLLEKIVSLNKSYVNEEVFSQFIELPNLVISQKSIRCQIKKILSQYIPKNHQECDPTQHQIDQLNTLLQKPYQNILLFTKLIKKSQAIINMKEFYVQFYTNLKTNGTLENHKTMEFAMSISKLFGNQLSKHLSSEEQKQFIELLTAKLNATNISILELQLYSRILRGMLISMNSDAFSLLMRIIQLEVNSEINLPLEFYNIVMNSKNSSQQKTYLFYSPTHAQRLFQTCIHTFHTKLNIIKTDSEFVSLKNKCYHVLTSTLLVSPFSIIKAHKTVCLPVLIEALTFSSDSQGLESAIKLLTRLINLDLEVIGNSGESLINCLLKLLKANDNSVNCSIEIIKCLAECIRFDAHIVKRFKKEVVDVMDSYLSHKKRRVRRQAVYTVNQWHQII